jgi:hypothetical protein
MDIKKLDLKTKLMAGTVLAVVSGFIPPISNTAVAGTATIVVDLEVVTAITLDTTTPLDFGRIAITAAPISGVHVLTPAGTVSTQGVGSAMVGATEAAGSINISGGLTAGNVTVTVSAAVDFDGGDASVDQLIFGGAGIVADTTIAAGATGTMSFGGGSPVIDVGGRITFSGAVAVGAYTNPGFTVNITDIP